ARFARLEPGHVVYLQADRVAESVREERAGYARFERALRSAADEPVFAKDRGQREARAQMQVGIALASHHAGGEPLLRLVPRVDQRLERACAVHAACGVRARDVAGI